MLFALALIPVIILLIVIYKKDKNEKEPKGLLAALFFVGMSTAVPAIIAEVIGDLILEFLFSYAPMLKELLSAFFVVAVVEELGKYLVLRGLTWKNKHFNYSYDAIVYSVFASLGFAAIENVGYVIGNGWGTGILRMFTAVPGHACFAVFMGFFYSKAKCAEVKGDKQEMNRNNALSLIFPILFHGVYDGIVMGGVASDDLLLTGLSLLLWVGFVFLMFAASIVVVIQAAKNDYCFVFIPDTGWTYYRPAVAGNWTCACGKFNQLNYCWACGRPRPTVNVWNCPNCGTVCTLRFCGNCGARGPYA